MDATSGERVFTDGEVETALEWAENVATGFELHNSPIQYRLDSIILPIDRPPKSGLLSDGHAGHLALLAPSFRLMPNSAKDLPGSPCLRTKW